MALDSWKIQIVGCLTLAISGCVSTQEMPVAPNVVRIDTQASGRLFVGQAVPQTMRAAAIATLNRGYTHFKLDQVSSGQGEQVAGAIGSVNGSAVTTGTANGSAIRTGNMVSANAFGQSTTRYSGFGSSSVVYRPTANNGATVIMFHAGDPQAKDAFDAEQVLKQYSQ